MEKEHRPIVIVAKSHRLKSISLLSLKQHFRDHMEFTDLTLPLVLVVHIHIKQKAKFIKKIVEKLKYRF